MINEVSAIMQNKNMFNKIVSAIKRKNIDTIKDVTFYMNEENYKAHFTMRFNIEMAGIDYVEAADWIYLCARIYAAPKVYWSSYYGSSEDPIARYLRDVLKYEPGNWRSSPEDTIRAVENATNLKCGTEYDESRLKNTRAYKVLNDSLSDMMSMKYDILLQDEVHKRLKQRKNIIPLAYYKTVEGEFNFPSDILPWGKPMATGCRSDYSLEYTVKNARSVADKIVRYTPWDYWTKIDFDVASKYVNLQRTMNSQ